MAGQTWRVISVLALALLLFVFIYILFSWYHPDRRLNLRSDFHISEACLQCICEAGERCNSSECFQNGSVSNNFRISQAYWTDAGMPTLEGSLEDIDDAEIVYLRCVNNPFCAARTVNDYVSKHVRDCDGNGLINCYDYARIHIKGHQEMFQAFSPLMAFRLQQCFDEFSVQ